MIAHRQHRRWNRMRGALLRFTAAAFAALAMLVAMAPAARAAQPVRDVADDWTDYYVVTGDGSLWATDAGAGYGHVQPIKMLDGVKKVDGHRSSSLWLALKDDGSLWGWGKYSSYADDAPDDAALERPNKIMDHVKDFRVASFGSLPEVFVIKDDGTLWAWGCIQGFGYGSDYSFTYPAVKIMDDVDSLDVVDGTDMYVIKRDRSLWTWNEETKKPEKLLDNMQSVFCDKGEWYAYAVGYDHSLWDLHHRSGNSHQVVPEKVMDGVKSVMKSYPNVYVIKTDDSLWAWDENYGSVSTAPVKILDAVKGVAARDSNNLYALKKDGSLYWWTKGSAKELAPRKIAEGISSIIGFGFIAKDDGTLWTADGGELDREINLPIATGYSDVAANHWVHAQGWLQYVTANGIMGGYQGRFAPEESLTRGQVAAILYRIANPNSDATTNPEHYGSDTGFSDGGSQRYYFAAVKWMKETGISTGDKREDGTPLNTFRPDARITRQELATLVYRFVRKQGVETGKADVSRLSRFRDGSEVQGYAREAMAWCDAAGVITGGQGSASGLIGPGQEATRAQAAKIFTVTKRDVLKR